MRQSKGDQERWVLCITSDMFCAHVLIDLFAQPMLCQPFKVFTATRLIDVLRLAL